jgi:hypothetical protein
MKKSRRLMKKTKVGDTELNRRIREEEYDYEERK